MRLARIGFDKVIGYLGDPGGLYLDRPDLVESSSRVTAGQLAAWSAWWRTSSWSTCGTRARRPWAP